MKLPNFSDSPVWVRCVCVCWTSWSLVAGLGVVAILSGGHCRGEAAGRDASEVAVREVARGGAAAKQNLSRESKKLFTAPLAKAGRLRRKRRRTDIFVVSFLVAPKLYKARLLGGSRSVKVMESQCLSLSMYSIPGITSHGALHF